MKIMAFRDLYMVGLLLAATEFNMALADKNTGPATGPTEHVPTGYEALLEGFNTLVKLTTDLQKTVSFLKNENVMIREQLRDLQEDSRKKDTVIQELKEKTSDLEKKRHTSSNGQHQATGFKKSGLQKRDIGDTSTHHWKIRRSQQGNAIERQQPVLTRYNRMLLDGQSPVVAFYATMTTDAKQLGQGQNIVFDHDHTNLGNAYHPFHGIFTAPYNGLYMLSATIGFNHMANVLFVNFIVNDNVVAKTRGHDYDLASHTLFLVLNKGDDFSLQSQGNMGNSYLLGGQYCSISGRLVTLLE